MISVIIPTMWKYEPFIEFLYDLCDHSLVEEIIIIDNSPKDRPEDFILSNQKVKIKSFPDNIFVNKAWNVGMDFSKNDVNCIISDSTIFDLRIFRKVYPYVHPNVGVVGLNSNNEMTGKIDIKKFNPGDSTADFFKCFFVNKRSWIKIPEQLDLYFGDDFIFNTCLLKGKDIFIINNLFCDILHGYTTGKIQNVKNIFENDKNEYRKILIQQGFNPKTFSPMHFKDD